MFRGLWRSSWFRGATIGNVFTWGGYAVLYFLNGWALAIWILLWFILFLLHLIGGLFVW